MSKIIYQNNIIKKKFHDWQHERFLNEIYWLKKFKNYNFTPQILNIDYEKKIIKLTNAGKKINSFNRPKNWVNQLKKILKALKQNYCFHGDINSENLLVKDKKLKLIDFAQSGKIFNENIIYIKKRMFFDEYSKNRINLSLKKVDFKSNDLRTLIVWDKSNDKLVYGEIKKNKNFRVIDKILLSKNCYEDIFKDRIFWLDKFYNREIDRYSPKFTKDAICYIILNKKSLFKKKKMLFTNEVRYVDSNIFEFKKKIRRKRRNIIHISDNFEEAKRNAFYISRNKKNYPYKYFTDAQFNHQSLNSLIKKLNRNKKLKYVFMRDKLDKYGDIDVLCNNYFLFKKEIDGQSFKHKNLKLISNSGDPVEDYGFKVANFVKIKGKHFFFDIRYLGDNYICEQWQKVLLKRKIKYLNYYTLNFKDKLYTLIYHIVYHKGYIDKKYYPILEKKFKKEKIYLKYLKEEIDNYLIKNNYKITRPLDLTIPMINKLSKQNFKNEYKSINKQIGKSNFSGANKMIFNLIKFQGLKYLLNIIFLQIVMKNQIKYLKNILKNIIFKKISRSNLKL